MASLDLKPIGSAPKARQINFVVKIPGAREVVLTGDFTNWVKDRIKLQKRGADEWKADFTLSKGTYQYRLLVDGQWQDHLGATHRVANPFGSQNCVLTVS